MIGAGAGLYEICVKLPPFFRRDLRDRAKPVIVKVMNMDKSFTSKPTALADKPFAVALYKRSFWLNLETGAR
ncbi:MAG: hypothetical protein VW981_03810 [Rhodobiaceae bacterium]